MEEIFVKIIDFPDYEISNYGRIRHGQRILKPFLVSKTYLGIHLMLGGIRFYYRINRLVAEHFLPVPDGKVKEDLIVNHKDLNKMNNHIANLEWLTQSANTRHALRFYGNFRNKKRMAKIRASQAATITEELYY